MAIPAVINASNWPNRLSQRAQWGIFLAAQFLIGFGVESSRFTALFISYRDTWIHTHRKPDAAFFAPFLFSFFGLCRPLFFALAAKFPINRTMGASVMAIGTTFIILSHVGYGLPSGSVEIGYHFFATFLVFGTVIVYCMATGANFGTLFALSSAALSIGMGVGWWTIWRAPHAILAIHWETIFKLKIFGLFLAGGALFLLPSKFAAPAQPRWTFSKKFWPVYSVFLGIGVLAPLTPSFVSYEVTKKNQTTIFPYLAALIVFLLAFGWLIDKKGEKAALWAGAIGCVTVLPLGFLFPEMRSGAIPIWVSMALAGLGIAVIGYLRRLATPPEFLPTLGVCGVFSTVGYEVCYRLALVKAEWSDVSLFLIALLVYISLFVIAVKAPAGIDPSKEHDVEVYLDPDDDDY